jgi:predicted Fe-Mo cluster-binding NifX family protein
MKIAVSTSGKDLNANFDQRFGRAAGFVVIETDTMEYSHINNECNLNAAQGAGIQTAQNIINAAVNAIITGHCGPNAFSVLSKANIKVYQAGVQTVKEAVDLFKQGKLTPMSAADVSGHW